MVIAYRKIHEEFLCIMGAFKVAKIADYFILHIGQWRRLVSVILSNG